MSCPVTILLLLEECGTHADVDAIEQDPDFLLACLEKPVLSQAVILIRDLMPREGRGLAIFDRLYTLLERHDTAMLDEWRRERIILAGYKII